MTTVMTEDELEVLPIAILGVDHSYQRDRKEALIKKMRAKGFDMNAAYPLKVSERPPMKGMSDPRYFLVDGQHRAHVAELEGETEVIASIVRFKGSESQIIRQEAALREKMGDRKADTPMEKFKAKLRAGDEVAFKIDNLVESYGGRIALKQNAPGIQAISTLQRLYEADVLTAVLRTIKTGWDTFDGRAGEAAALDGIAWLLKKHPDVDIAHLTRRMRGAPPEAIHARAHAIKAVMQGSLWKNYYRALLEFYNTRAPSKIKRLTPMDF